jgi:hypothetical protein
MHDSRELTRFRLQRVTRGEEGEEKEEKEEEEEEKWGSTERHYMRVRKKESTYPV